MKTLNTKNSMTALFVAMGIAGLGACAGVEVDDLDADALEAELEAEELGLLAEEAEEAEEAEVAEVAEEAEEADTQNDPRDPGPIDDLAASPDADRFCCIETCADSRDFCLTSVIPELGSRCSDAVIDVTAGCANPQSQALENLCNNQYNDCLGHGSSWTTVNNWYYSQTSGCDTGFSNCMSGCPV